MVPCTIVSFCLFAFLLPLLLAAPSFANDSATIVRMVDGDTVEIMLKDQKEKVRLIGVDTPEKFESDKLHRDAAGLVRMKLPSGHSGNAHQTSPSA